MLARGLIAVCWISLPVAAVCLGVGISTPDPQVRNVLLAAGALGLLPAASLLFHPKHGDRVEREDRYKSLFENVLEGVYQTAPDGTIRSANPALVRLLGYENAADLIGRKAGDFYADAQDREYNTARLEADGELRNVELVLRRADGSVITVLENSRRVVDRKGAVSYEGTLADITERKEAEWELLRYTFEAESARRRVEEQAAQLQRQAEELKLARDTALEASRLKSAFLANVSHEIRTPMNGILGMLDALLAKPQAAEDREYAEMARSSAHHLLQIINDLLDLSKMEAGRLTLSAQRFALRTVIEDTLEMLAARAGEKNLELTYLLEPGVPEQWHGDAGRLRQILTNLAGNAIKFTEKGRVRIECSAHGEMLRFVVRDTGIGVPPEIQERLFEPFYQADGSWSRRFGGTGLGLAISRELAQLLGGEIGVESEEGEGSRFWFTVHMRPQEAQPPRRPLGARVLVASARPDTRSMVQAQLLAAGVEAGAASPGEALLERLRVEHWPLIVLDARGDELDVLAKAPPGIRVLLLTRFGERTPPNGAYPRAVGACLSHPARQSQLLRALAGLKGEATPLSVKNLAETLGPQEPAPEAPAVLIAEDNKINQRVAAQLVLRLGYRPEVVANGREAVEAMARQEYPVILMDCQMPEMDGFAATAAIRASGSRAVIIAMTANAMRGDREKCLAAGMDDYLSKPVDAGELGRLLARWLAVRAAENNAGAPAPASVAQ